MSLVTTNLFARLDFTDGNSITFQPADSAFISDQINNNDFRLANVSISTYTAAGNTRYSSNVKFKNELTADHGYYIHRYL